MPLRKTVYGGECPLDKFKIVEPGGGCYTADPVEKCFDCNFADHDQEGFDLEEICQCPADMTWDEYDKLRKEYASTEGRLTKAGFLKFVEENYQAPTAQNSP